MHHNYWVAFQSLLRKEINRFLRIWIQTLLPPAITMTLYFIIFGKLIGSQIDNMGGYSYMEFIVPGLIMMSVITNSYANVAASFFTSKFHHSIEELLVAPVPTHIIIAGYVGGGVVRGLLVVLLVTIVSLFFVPLAVHSFIHIIGITLLAATLFSLAGLLNAIYAKSFDDVNIIPTFVLTPLTYLGGVFYSISLLPPVWQNISKLNPIIYMVNAFRYGFLGVTDVALPLAYGMIALFIGIFYAITWWLIETGRGLRH